MNRLKDLRIEKGLLQSDIAKIINKSERTVGFYESGERDMNTETLAILADFFNCSIDYLLGKSDIRNAEEFDENKLYFALSQEDKGYISEEVKNDILRYAKFVIEEEKKKKKK